mgnify:FL=1
MKEKREFKQIFEKNSRYIAEKLELVLSQKLEKT